MGPWTGDGSGYNFFEIGTNDANAEGSGDYTFTISLVGTSDTTPPTITISPVNYPLEIGESTLVNLYLSEAATDFEENDMYEFVDLSLLL